MVLHTALGKLRLAGALALALVFSIHLPAAEAGSEQKLSPEQLRQASELFDDTWSPFCPGRTLSSCTSGAAADWRKDVRAWLAEGLTKDEILGRLQARVPGFQLDSVPDTTGTRYGPWVLGGVFLAVLVGLAFFHARHSGTRDDRPSAGVPPENDLDRRVLNAELAALED